MSKQLKLLLWASWFLIVVGIGALGTRWLNRH